MTENKDEVKIIEGHDYDGIQELDHPLPKWWLMTFYGCVIFAIGYVGYYEFLGGPTGTEELETQMAKIEASKKTQDVSEAPEKFDVESASC